MDCGWLGFKPFQPHLKSGTGVNVEKDEGRERGREEYDPKITLRI